MKSKLPAFCQDIQIKPNHKVELTHRISGNEVWVILLTIMPGKNSLAWRMNKTEYFRIMPKHGTRDRWIRENVTPTIVGDVNVPILAF